MMSLLQFITLATTITLIAANLVGADSPENSSKIHKLLKEALLTEYNVYALQTAFYPSGFQISNVDLYVTIQGNNFAQRNDCPSTFTFNSKSGYSETTYIMSISTQDIGELQKYEADFDRYLVGSFDLSFYYTLSILTKYQNKLGISTSAELVLYIDNMTSNFDCYDYCDPLQTLFTWVRLKKNAIHLCSLFM